MDFYGLIGWGAFALIGLAISLVARLVSRVVRANLSGPAGQALRTQLTEARAAAQRGIRTLNPTIAPPPPARASRPQPRPVPASRERPAPARAPLLGAFRGGPALLRSIIVAEALAPPVSMRDRPPGVV